MNYKSFLTYSIITTLIIFTLIFKYAFDESGKPHCENFVSNVYLYLALAIAMLGNFIHVVNYFVNEPNQVGKYISAFEAYFQVYKYVIPAIILSFIFVISLTFRDNFSKDGFLLNHFIWLAYIATLAIPFYPIFKSIEFAQDIIPAMLSTISVFALMSFVVYSHPEFFESTYKSAIIGLIIALLFGIIIHVIMNMTGLAYLDNSFTRFFNYFFIVVFSLFVSYDTSRVLQLAEQCVNMPNYPRISNKLFLDIINLFSRMLRGRR